MIPPDHLRPPSPGDPTAASYKEWLHLNLFDHDRGRAGLVNVSQHGASNAPSTVVVGAALLHDPLSDWVGNLVIRSTSEACITDSGIGLDAVALTAETPSGTVFASATRVIGGLRLRIEATPETQGHAIERPQPFGSGWIAWRVVPRLRAEGWATIPGEPVDYGYLCAYHDHNWGRWHWGENIGWDWGSFQSPNKASIVLAHTTDAAHQRTGPACLIVDIDCGRRIFTGGRVRLSWSRPDLRPTRRFPGALAALRADRAGTRVPRELHVVANDGSDSVELQFVAESAAQLILADPVLVGYSFLHEMVGTFVAQGQVNGGVFETRGLAVVERLE